MALKKPNIDRQLIKPARRGLAEESSAFVGDSSISSTIPRRMRTSGRTTTVLKRGCEPSPATSLCDASPVLPVRCRAGHVSTEEDHTLQSLWEKKSQKEKKRTRKSNSRASASPPSSMKQATHRNVRAPRDRNNLGTDVSCCSSYSSPQHGESLRFFSKKSKMTRNSLRRPSVKRDIIFGKHSIGAASSPLRR
jgi:hypothetical protein